MLPIRQEFLQYMKGLGYSAPEIHRSWKDAQLKEYMDYPALELMTQLIINIIS